MQTVETYVGCKYVDSDCWWWSSCVIRIVSTGLSGVVCQYLVDWLVQQVVGDRAKAAGAPAWPHRRADEARYFHKCSRHVVTMDEHVVLVDGCPWRCLCRMKSSVDSSFLSIVRWSPVFALWMSWSGWNLYAWRWSMGMRPLYVVQLWKHAEMRSLRCYFLLSRTFGYYVCVRRVSSS